MKNFHFADSSELMAVRLISASEPKNVWFEVSIHVLRRVHEKFSFLEMMYVEFIKNFLLADSIELMAVRLISSSWAQKRLIPSFQTWCTLSSWKIFFSPIRASWLAVRLISASWAQKSFDCFFLDMMYVEFMKNFRLAHSTELMVVRLHFGLLSPKRFIPTF